MGFVTCTENPYTIQEKGSDDTFKQSDQSSFHQGERRNHTEMAKEKMLHTSFLCLQNMFF